MIKIIEKSKCCGCHACFNSCPQKCISMIEDEEGFLYPHVDETKCVNCGACERVCPFINTQNDRSFKPSSYAVKSSDTGIIKESSSGGFFSHLALYVLQHNGTVYGSTFNSDYSACEHIRISSINELEKLRGSKYIQSKINLVYSNVKKELLAGKKVLFSGVPCQVAGLKSFLQKEYDNLLTCEVICHGVPSTKLWIKYLDYLKTKYDADVVKVNFRKKMDSNDSYGIYKNSDCIRLFEAPNNNIYMRFFLNDLCLRPSCYNCVSKKAESRADFTLGDLWGVDMISPKFDDEKGTSLVFLNTQKAERIFDSIKINFQNEVISYDKCVFHNSSYLYSAKISAKRTDFYKELEKKNIAQLYKLYFPISVKDKIKSVLKLILRKKNHYNRLKFSYGLEIILKKANEKE